MLRTKTIDEYISWVRGLIDDDPLLLRYGLNVHDEETNGVKALVPQSNMLFVVNGDERTSRRILENLGYRGEGVTSCRMKIAPGLCDGKHYERKKSEAIAAWFPEVIDIKLMESDGVLYRWGAPDEARLVTANMQAKGWFQLSHFRHTDMSGYDLDQMLSHYKHDEPIRFRRGKTTIEEFIRRLGSSIITKRTHVDGNLEALQMILDEGTPVLYGNAVSPLILAYQGFEI